MTVVSLRFMALMAAVITLYFIVPRKHQWCVILAGSLFFYGCSGIKNGVYILATSLVSFLCARKISDINREKKVKAGSVPPEEKKAVNRAMNAGMKRYLWLGIVLCGGAWIVLKYTELLHKQRQHDLRRGTLQGGMGRASGDVLLHLS